MIKIKLHSITDLITNSSTVIFTYSKGCVEPLKEMFAEIAKTFGITKSFDEMFDIVIAANYGEIYEDYLQTLGEEWYPEGVDSTTDIDALFKDVIAGKIPKPEWFNEAEDTEYSYDNYLPSTNLYLIPKDEKYRNLGKSIVKFLYSTDHEATQD